MANKNYTLYSNSVFSGIPTSIANDVAAGVWTPTADEYGRILDASWANLPLNEFVAVAGSEPQRLLDQLTSAGLDFNRISSAVGNITKTFNAWVGCVVDSVAGRVFIPRGGGHADGSVNGVWEYNLEHIFGWSVFNNPSDPEKVGFEFDESYIGSGTFTTYPNQDGELFRKTTLPDGKPTSAHTYAGCWLNPVSRNIETSRSCRWSYSLDVKGKAPERAYFRVSGSDVSISINNWQFFDELDNKIKGYVPLSSGGADGYYTINYDSNIMVSMSAGWPTKSVARNGRKLHCFGSSSKYRVLDLDLLGWDSSEQVTTWESSSQADQEMVACVYIPQMGKILRRFSSGGRWILFNPATLINEDFTPSGNIPPTTDAIGNKYFYYEKRKCLVCIAATTVSGNSIYLMRLE